MIPATLTIVSDRDIEDAKCGAHAKHVFIFSMYRVSQNGKRYYSAVYNDRDTEVKTKNTQSSGRQLLDQTHTHYTYIRTTHIHIGSI